LSAAGCYADAIELKELLQSQCRKYTWDHEKIMSLTALSYTLSNVLFERRIQLPYLSHCLISGIDDNNKTCIYRYDVLGSKSNLLPNQFVCIGNGEKLIQPYLDSVMSNITNSVSNDIDYTNRQLWTVNKNDFIFEEKETNSICSDCNISCDNKTSHLQYNERNESILQSNILHTKQILLYALRSASERDITIGDGLEFVTITNKYGVEREIVSLPLH
jgi:20S proteasome alpha/beta subunit